MSLSTIAAPEDGPRAPEGAIVLLGRHITRVEKRAEIAVVGQRGFAPVCLDRGAIEKAALALGLEVGDARELRLLRGAAGAMADSFEKTADAADAAGVAGEVGKLREAARALRIACRR